jgi:hypothetical protein
MLKHTKLFTALIFSTVLSGCGLFSDVYQEESRRIINYLLADFPLPSDADIQKLPTVILGTGTGIAGRIVLYSELSPAENLIFYGNSTQGSGWDLVSSTVAEEIILVYTKEGRHATIEILRRGSGFGRLTGGSNTSQITISVVHPGAIQEQNPYLALDTQRTDLEGALAQQD